MAKTAIALLILSIAISFISVEVFAAQTVYNVQMNYLDANGTLQKASKVYDMKCNDLCVFPLDLDLLPNSTLVNYTVSYPDGNYQAYFTSTKTNVVMANDSVTVELKPQEPPANIPPVNNTQPPVLPPALSCSNDGCDTAAGCVRCEDGNCHQPGFQCIEQLTLDKITPDSTKMGITQLNVLLRNTGTIDLKDISAEASGDGITTLDKIPMDKLVVGDKDYAFIKVNATKAGKIDLVIKIYINGALRSKLISQLIVTEEKAQPTATQKEQEYNAIELTKRLDDVRVRRDSLEKQYQQKKIEGYIVDIISDKLKDVDRFLTSAQAALFNGDYKIAKTNLEVANESLGDIETRLNDAIKQEQSFADMIRANILYVGAIAAALVSMFSLISHFRKVVNKEKLARLKDKVNFAKKDKELAKEIKKVKKKVKTHSHSKKASKKKEEELDGGMTV